MLNETGETAINVCAIVLIKNPKDRPQSLKEKAKDTRKAMTRALKPKYPAGGRIADIKYGFQT